MKKEKSLELARHWMKVHSYKFQGAKNLDNGTPKMHSKQNGKYMQILFLNCYHGLHVKQPFKLQIKVSFILL